VFNFVNEKRKQGLEKLHKDKESQADSPPSGISKKSSVVSLRNGIREIEANDFAKIVDTLLTKAKSGNFDEPLPEIPFLGICNRLSCGDLYKAVDEFRKSEFFSNFQVVLTSCYVHYAPRVS